MEEEKYPDPHRAAFQLPREAGAGAFPLRGGRCLMLTEEFGPLPATVPGATQSSHVWKGQIATLASRLPASSGCSGSSALMSCGGARAQTGTQPRVMSNAAASVTQGVSCRNCGFLTAEASTSPPREDKLEDF